MESRQSKLIASKGDQARDNKNKMNITHLLVVRVKSSNRLHLKARFENKASAEAASLAILRANPDRFSVEISFIGSK